MSITGVDGARRTAHLGTVSLAKLQSVEEGVIVITAKATGNRYIASELTRLKVGGPLVILQNGVGVETPFLEAGFPGVLRCVLYATAQSDGENSVQFRPVAASPIGRIKGEPAKLTEVVETLNSDGFPFRVEERLDEEVWRKAIMNAVFNTVCPLLEVDNGIFIRDSMVAGIAVEILRECIAVTRGLGMDFKEEELMEQLMMISRRSDGQLISTLQDLKKGNETEIEFLNLAIAKIAAGLEPPVEVGRTKVLGELILKKSELRRRDALTT
jgi:2-dehydropantoate 2-reductase